MSVFASRRDISRGCMTERIAQELEHRWQLWRTLLATGGPTGMSPQRLRALGMYGGAQGVWVDKARTALLTANGDGVTVGVLHTGTAYADDLSVDGVLYHYPRTQRPRAAIVPRFRRPKPRVDSASPSLSRPLPAHTRRRARSISAGSKGGMMRRNSS
jgi:putative restriction endonuclease